MKSTIILSSNGKKTTRVVKSIIVIDNKQYGIIDLNRKKIEVVREGTGEWMVWAVYCAKVGKRLAEKAQLGDIVTFEDSEKCRMHGVFLRIAPHNEGIMVAFHGEVQCVHFKDVVQVHSQQESGVDLRTHIFGEAREVYLALKEQCVCNDTLPSSPLLAARHAYEAGNELVNLPFLLADLIRKGADSDYCERFTNAFKSYLAKAEEASKRETHSTLGGTRLFQLMR